MRKSKRSPRNSALPTVLLVTALAACSSPTSPTSPFAWAGTYGAQTRFGGCGGTWGNGTQGSHLLVITPDGGVTQNGTKILNPTLGDSTVTWSVSDGNGSNANITFYAASANPCFWGLVAQTGPLFEGSIQFVGEGPLDYRGLKQ